MLVFIVLFVFSFVFSLILSSIGIDIIKNCKDNQKNGKLRNKEDQEKDKITFIWFCISIIISLSVFIVFCILLFIFKKKGNIEENVLKLLYCCNLIFLILNTIISSCGWSLTNSCDDESLKSDSLILHEREIFITCLFFSLCILIVMLCN